MGKRGKIQAMNGDSQLPEPLIHHIQSFLTGKEAAQTTVLSKSWYTAWLTRPNLDFNQLDLQRTHCQGRRKTPITHDGFPEFSKKTMKRYEELNLRIESFRLRMNDWNSKSLANELIAKAVELGATDVEFVDLHNYACVVPDEVLESETLVNLSVKGGKIGLGVDGKVKCSRLKSLCLSSMYTDGDIIWDIISSCPLIENLSLSNIMCFFKLDTFDAFTRKMAKMLPPSPFNGFGKQRVGSVVDGPTTLHAFQKLKCLVLEKVYIDSSIFCDFSSKFPCLKDLSVHDCAGYNRIQISSRSLECISFTRDKVLRANFDVPRIRKFSYSGAGLPAVSFENASREWESDIDVTCWRPGTKLFVRLRKLLAKLSKSKVSLSIFFDNFSEKSYDYARDVKGLPKPTLENMKVSVFERSGISSSHLDALIWSCRPKFITQDWLPKSSPEIGLANKELLDLFCKTLVEEASENNYIPNRSMCGLLDLEEVNVEMFEESVAEWQPLSWKTLLDASEGPETKREIRFKLKWG